MRKLMILAALLAAVPAWAQTKVQDGNSTRTSQQLLLGGGLVRADSTGKAFTMSSTGGLSTYDEDRDRNYYRTWQASEVISTSSLAAGAGDSSAVIDVSAYRYLKLLIKATPINTPNNNAVRIAFQFRECLNGNVDSTSAFPEYQYGMFPVGSITASTVNDTIVAGHMITGGFPTPWSGEYTVAVNTNRSAYGNSVAVVPWYYPSGISLPLDSMFGRSARFANLQIRVRNLSNSAVKLDVSMIGFAQ